MNANCASRDKNYSHGYSEYWRRNKSSLESWELAHVLTALRKVGAYIAANIKPIDWIDGSASLPDLTKNRILLDIGTALGEYPVPSQKMDRLVGLVVREAYRCRELSDMVWLYLRPAAESMKAGHRQLLHNLADIGEDIYVRHIAGGQVWKRYLDTGWDLSVPAGPGISPFPPQPTAFIRSGPTWEWI